MTKKLDGIILLPHLRVQNANVISGPLSWGFPSPTAFTGLVHALHRKLGTPALPTADLETSTDLALEGVGIVCHLFEPQVYRVGRRQRFKLSKNPVESPKKIDKDGALAGTSIIEEGRVHLEISLLIGVQGSLDLEDAQVLAQRVTSAVQHMRIAGGSVLTSKVGAREHPRFHKLSGYLDEDRQAFRRLRRKLLPGFALMDRHDLLKSHHAVHLASDPSVDLLDTLLDLCALHHQWQHSDEEGQKGSWRVVRRNPGWLVPLPVGYAALSPLYEPGQVANTRDPAFPFCFVESIYSLGEWRSPHRVDSVRDLLWTNKDMSSQGLYLTTQNNAAECGE